MWTSWWSEAVMQVRLTLYAIACTDTDSKTVKYAAGLRPNKGLPAKSLLASLHW